MEQVSVVLSHPYQGGSPGDKVALDAETAERLVDVGRAQFATKTDAKAVGADPALAVTSQ